MKLRKVAVYSSKEKEKNAHGLQTGSLYYKNDISLNNFSEVSLHFEMFNNTLFKYIYDPSGYMIHCVKCLYFCPDQF